MNEGTLLYERKTKKIKLFLLVFLLTVVGLLKAQNTTQTISLNLKNVSLKEFFKQIESKTPFSILYRDVLLDNKNDISINVNNKPLNEILTSVLSSKGLTATFENNTIVITKLQIKSKAIASEPIKISGQVVDEKGEPIIGATIKIENSNVGTITNTNGEFIIDAHVGDRLIISYVGYEAKNITITEKTNNYKIVLTENSEILDEVVVIGYGSVRKSDLTGSVSTIKTTELKTIPSNSIDGLLQGRVAGLQVISSSQDPGAGSTIRLRGESSLRGSNAPLVVVDGFPMGDAGNLMQINPNDIESVEVLKDASASAIYGSRGANGVIVITTRKAKEGQTVISFKNQLTCSQFTSDLVRFKDPILMMQLSNESRVNSGYDPLYVGAYSTNQVYYPSIQEVESGAWPYYTDWAEIVFRDMPLLNNSSISISNANEKTSFNLSGNLFTEQGVFIKDNYLKGIVNISMSHKLTNNFKISSSINVTKDKRNNNTGLSYNRNPLYPIYTEDGDYYKIGNQDYSHPLALTNTKKNITQRYDCISYLMFDWGIHKTLDLRSQINYRKRTGVTDAYYPKKYTSEGASNNGAASIDTNESEDILSDLYLTYKPELGKRNELSIMAGISYETYLGRSYSMSSYDFVNETLQNENMAVGNPTLNKHSNGYTQTKLLSYVFRTNYTYNDKYLATITARADGSSKFGENNKWAFFPSAALAWKAHNESFINNLDVFDELKVRASYGVSGNQGISPYQTLSRYGIDTYFANGKWETAIGPGYIVARTGADSRYTEWGGIPNKNLKWESTAQADFGIDMSFFNKRLRLTFDYYNKHTYDLLRESYVSLSSGFDKMWINDGEISNKGIELTIDGLIISTKDWNLSSTLIFSRNRNKVLSLGNSQSAGLLTDPKTGMQYEYYGNTQNPFRQTSPNILAIGYPVNVFYGYLTTGIVQTHEEGLEAGLKGYEAEPGEFKFIDLSGNGIFDESDRIIVGDPNPDFTASLNLRLNYKNIDMGIFLYGVYGNDVLETDLYNSPQFTPLRWTLDNRTNDFPKLRENRLYYVSDWFIRDGSYLRIQNLNIGYTFKQFKHFQNSRIFLNVDNLYTFTSFKGYDPEVRSHGRYTGGYPRLRKITLGIELTF